MCGGGGGTLLGGGKGGGDEGNVGLRLWAPDVDGEGTALALLLKPASCMGEGGQAG